jgi:hypothetical protein
MNNVMECMVSHSRPLGNAAEVRGCEERALVLDGDPTNPLRIHVHRLATRCMKHALDRAASSFQEQHINMNLASHWQRL